MTEYITRQRKILSSYFEKHIHEEISAKQIAAELSHFPISRSAVYRNLSAMESEGKLYRCSREGENTAYYRYVGDGGCRGLLHLSCKKCGKNFHMKKDATDSLVRELAENCGFEIDRGETVLYGLCENCS